jgi:hypothetical protein
MSISSVVRTGALAALFLSSALAATGCQTNQPAPNRGVTNTADPAKRVNAEEGLASKDVVSATDDMVQQIAAKPEFRNSPTRIQIVMDRVANKTSMGARNFDVYLARIRANLNQAGTRYNIGFVLKRGDVEGVRESEGLPAAGPTKADYVLRGEIYDLPNTGADYYFMSFQIVDIRDNEIVWEGSYEAKFAS